MTSESDVGVCGICGLEGPLEQIQEHFMNEHVQNTEMENQEINETNEVTHTLDTTGRLQKYVNNY